MLTFGVFICHVCYKDYPGLGNRSIVYPYSSVGKTFTYNVVLRHGFKSHFERFFCKSACACVLKQIYLPGFPDIETKRVGQRTAEYGTDAPTIPPFRGGESVTRITLGWVIDRFFYPCSPVGKTFTRAYVCPACLYCGVLFSRPPSLRRELLVDVSSKRVESSFSSPPAARECM